MKDAICSEIKKKHMSFEKVMNTSKESIYFTQFKLLFIIFKSLLILCDGNIDFEFINCNKR